MPKIVNDDLTRRPSPEEEELARKRDELSRLQSILVDRELELADLRAELSAFESLYLRTVGVRFTPSLTSGAQGLLSW